MKNVHTNLQQGKALKALIFIVALGSLAVWYANKNPDSEVAKFIDTLTSSIDSAEEVRDAMNERAEDLNEIIDSV